jgi:hypothetical protein
MKAAYSIKPARPPHKPGMRGRRKATAVVMAVLSAGLAGGCVTVDAPTEPIVIELNINITQEVIYRLAGDVQENIEANPEIF